MATDDIRLLLGAQTDKASIDRVKADLSRFNKDIKSSADDVRKSFAGAAAGADDLTKRLRTPGDSELKKAAAAADDLRKKLQGAADVKAPDIGGSFGAAEKAGRGLTGLADLAGGGGLSAGTFGDIGDLIESLPDLKSAVSGLPSTISSAAAAIGPAGLLVGAALIGVGAAIANFVAAQQDSIGRLNAAADSIRTIEEAKTQFTEDQARQQLDNLKAQLETEQEILRQNQELRDELFQKESEALGDLGARLNETLTGAPNEINENITEAQANIDNLTAQIDAFGAALDKGEFKAGDAAQAEETLTAARGGSSQAALDAARAEEQATREREQAAKEAEQEQKRAAEQAQREAEQRAKQVQQIQQNIANAQQKYNDSLVDIADKYADDLKGISAKLQQAREDINTKGLREEQDAQAKLQADKLDKFIEFNRVERDSAIQHAQNLKNIREQAKEDEFDLALNRDFRGLAALQRNQKKELNAAQSQYEAEKAARARGYNDQISDLNRAAERERQQRLINNQRALQDAALSANRERQDAGKSRNQAARDADQARQREIKAQQAAMAALLGVRQAGLQAELNLVKSAANAAAEAQRPRPSGPNPNLFTPTGTHGIYNNTFGGSVGIIKKRARGGLLNAGDLSLVNEAGSSGRESFQSGKQLVNFPGAGVFMPTQTGRVNANRGAGSITINAPVTVNGTNASAADIAAQVASVIRDELLDVLGA